MDTLQKLIKNLNKEEIRFFKLYISRTQDNPERKDIMLFDYIRRSGSNYNENYILSKLYKQNNKNAFYRLKNRLLNDINTSLYLQHFDKDEETYILHLISMSKFYYNRNEQKLSINFLKKAEHKAAESQKFELLDIVYTEFIKYSLEFSEIPIEEYVEKRNTNTNELKKLNQINQILASIGYKLKHTENLSEGNKLIFPLLKKTIDDITTDPQLKNSTEFRLKIYVKFFLKKEIIQHWKYIYLQHF